MDFLVVKNWQEFQHYRDRLPPWIKLHRGLLTDYAFCHLPDETKGHLVMTWLLASQMDGRIPNDAQWIGQRIGAQGPFDLQALIDGGWLVREQGKKKSKEKWPSRYVSQELRAAVMNRDGSKCIVCSATIDLEVDHIVPVSKGGPSEFNNLQVLCRPCNRRKRVRSVEQVATQNRSLETETYKATEAEKKNNGGVELAEWVPKTAWQDFVAYRKQQKGWTAKAEVLLLRELEKLYRAGNDPTAVLERSIANGWKGLFPISGGGGQNQSRAERQARNMDILTGKVRDERVVEGVAQRVDRAAVLTLPSNLREPNADDVEGRGPDRSASSVG